jgi:hypothetical protein
MRTRDVDLEETSFSNQPSDRQSFLEAALVDLGVSPWAEVVARAKASGERPVARPSAPAPRPEPAPRAPVKIDAESVPPRPAPIPEPPAAKPQPAVAQPQAAPAQATSATATASPPEAESALVAAAIPEPDPLPVAPIPHRFSGIPPESPLARIESGMRHDEVERILGSPDGRIDRLTAKAWIPFYDSPEAALREWIYAGRGRVVFSLYHGSLEVVDVVYDPSQEK